VFSSAKLTKKITKRAAGDEETQTVKENLFIVTPSKNMEVDLDFVKFLNPESDESDSILQPSVNPFEAPVLEAKTTLDAKVEESSTTTTTTTTTTEAAVTEAEKKIIEETVTTTEPATTTTEKVKENTETLENNKSQASSENSASIFDSFGSSDIDDASKITTEVPVTKVPTTIEVLDTKAPTTTEVPATKAPATTEESTTAKIVSASSSSSSSSESSSAESGEDIFNVNLNIFWGSL
jgi:hypothetical protein